MKKIEQFQITSLMLSGFKSYEEPTELVFGNPTVITGGNGRGKSSIADAIAFAVTGCPFFGERGIDRLHNENNPDVAIRMCFVDETGTLHELNRTRRKNRMTITYDGYEIRQLDLADLFGERDVFLSILNPLYFIEELGEDGKKLLERYLPTIPHETVLSQLSEPVREHLKNETILSPEGSLKRCREEIRGLEERITYLRGQKDLAASQGESHEQAEQELTLQADTLREEIAELEQRQFSGMDVSDMQERLVELSGRYEEAARDERTDTSKLREQIQTLREKIARREGEQYQSKFTEALAEASARVKDLGVRYQRENAAYDVVKSTGEVKDTFKFQYGGRRYDRLSLSEKIRAGMEVSELMKRLTGRNYPVFVDNMESVDDLANVRPTGQIIMAKCVSGAALQVKPIRPIAFAEQRAA